jgi:hypothetical protein
MNKYKYSIVTPARWETTTILEWLTYHKSIGFDHVYLYCNDDDPAELFDQISPYLIGPQPFVTFMHYPFQGLQWDMYLHWFRKYSFETEWISFLDADEFLVLPGIDNISEFVSRFPADCEAIHFHWIYYGTNGFITRPPGSVLRQYTRRTSDVSAETKTMVQTGKIDPERLRPSQTPFWHIWDESQDHTLQCYTSLGDLISQPFDRDKLATESADLIRWTAYIAHFALKSEADFIRRMERGLGGQFQRQHIWADSIKSGEALSYINNTNKVEDTYLKSYWERIVGNLSSTSIIARPQGINVALGKSATQSSVSEWSVFDNPEQEAAGAISGSITGRPASQTDEEQSPWWQVDLGEQRIVSEIRVFNRVDDMGVASRINRLILLSSQDGEVWHPIYNRISDVPFGGADGNPLIWKASAPLSLRYLRVMVPVRTYLGLDQVEVYGPPI